MKLGRAEEAVEAFAPTEEGRDALLDYYRGIACYEARLYLCADRLLAVVGARSGPRIAQEATKARAAIASELAKEPAQPTIDWYLARCGAAGSRPIDAGSCVLPGGGRARRAESRPVQDVRGRYSALEPLRRRGGVGR